MFQGSAEWTEYFETVFSIEEMAWYRLRETSILVMLGLDCNHEHQHLESNNSWNGWSCREKELWADQVEGEPPELGIFFFFLLQPEVSCGRFRAEVKPRHDPGLL